MVPHAAWPCAIFFLACVRRAFEAQTLSLSHKRGKQGRRYRILSSLRAKRGSSSPEAPGAGLEPLELVAWGGPREAAPHGRGRGGARRPDPAPEDPLGCPGRPPSRRTPPSAPPPQPPPSPPGTARPGRLGQGKWCARRGLARRCEGAGAKIRIFTGWGGSWASHRCSHLGPGGG